MNRKELWLVVGVSIISSLATLGLVMVFWGGQTALAKDNPTPQKEVRAQSFVLVDKEGNPRADLIMSEDSPGLSFNDRDGKRRLYIGLTSKTEPMIAFNDKDENRRVDLSLLDNGAPKLSFFEKNKTGFTSLGVYPEGGGWLIFKKAKAGIALTMKGDGTPELTFNDKNDKIVWQAPPGDIQMTGRTWVLWGQVLSDKSVYVCLPDNVDPRDQSENIVKPVAVALGAWATKGECEDKRSHYIK